MASIKNKKLRYLSLTYQALAALSGSISSQPGGVPLWTQLAFEINIALSVSILLVWIAFMFSS